MTRRLAVVLALALAACLGDETVTEYGGGGQPWRLTEIDGAAYGASATLSFDGAGRISGEAPCNRYSGRMAAPYPWFEATAVVATRRACPDIAAEAAFFAALEAMSLAEVSGGTLILSTPEGRQMVFTRPQP